MVGRINQPSSNDSRTRHRISNASNIGEGLHLRRHIGAEREQVAHFRLNGGTQGDNRALQMVTVAAGFAKTAKPIASLPLTHRQGCGCHGTSLSLDAIQC